MPTLQQKEALASSMLECTQATLDGVLINQVATNDKDKNINEVKNYYIATVKEYGEPQKVTAIALMEFLKTVLLQLVQLAEVQKNMLTGTVLNKVLTNL